MKRHEAVIEERRDEDAYSDTARMPGRVWMVATCCVWGHCQHHLIDRNGVRFKTAEEAIAGALYWLDYDCGVGHVIAGDASTQRRKR